MSVFLDTGVIVAFDNPSDRNHEMAVQILETAATGLWGDVVTSDFIFDEAVTLALARTRRPEVARRVGSLILGTGPLGRLMGLAYVSPRLFLRAWALFSRLASRGLSFTDCTSLELIRSMGISGIASFNRDFDGLVARRSDTADAA